MIYVITGGIGHIGAVATAYIDGGEIQCQVVECPGHREGPLAKELAQLAAFVLGRTVTVTVGIHLEHATSKEIVEMVQLTRHQMLREWF